MKIGESTKITLHFSLALESGELVDSNFDKTPATFIFGDGNLLAGFEQVLVGLEAGDTQQFVVTPENAFGQPNPNNLQSIALSQFETPESLESGLMLSFADANGHELPGVVIEVDETKALIDFNHPLAGKTIVFNVEILNVTPSVTH